MEGNFLQGNQLFPDPSVNELHIWIQNELTGGIFVMSLSIIACRLSGNEGWWGTNDLSSSTTAAAIVIIGQWLGLGGT